MPNEETGTETTQPTGKTKKDRKPRSSAPKKAAAVETEEPAGKNFRYPAYMVAAMAEYSDAKKGLTITALKEVVDAHLAAQLPLEEDAAAWVRQKYIDSL